MRLVLLESLTMYCAQHSTVCCIVLYVPLVLGQNAKVSGRGHAIVVHSYVLHYS